MNTQSPDSFFVVGIGASAGGLAALETFFRNLPENTGAAFIVVQHLSPDFESLMDQLLRRHTNLAVQVAEEGTALAPERIYLIPPGQNLFVQDRRISLRPQEEHRRPPLAIDVFFDSLAHDVREHAIAVILSGTGTDGSVGIRAIKNVGGIVLVQEPTQAEFDGMPRSALRTGVVDLVLPAQDMGRTIVSYMNASLLPLESSPLELKEAPLARIFEILKSRTRVDFSSYRDKTLFRRLGRRMSILQCSSLEDLADRLMSSNEEIDALYEDLLIGVTRFFRDPEAHELWVERLPKLVELVGAGPVRVWIPGCSTGEEPYTIAMCFEEYSAKQRLPVDYKIFATDLNKRSLAHASEGVFSPSITETLGQERVETFFQRVDRGYRISPKIRGRVVFATHNLIDDPPFTRMHFVSCRNLLIYLERRAQEHALRAISFALKPGGMLMLGPSETLGPFARHYSTENTRWKLYQRKASVADSVETQADPAILPKIPAGTGSVATQRNWLDLERIVAHSINHFVPACVITDERGRILHSFGQPNHYLRMSAGRASLDMMQMLSSEARSFISTAMHRAQSSDGPMVCHDVRFAIDGKVRHAQVTIRYIPPENSTGSPGMFLVLFGEPQSPQQHESAIDIDSRSITRIEMLERELDESRKSLNSMIEELEGSNEELQSTNEELLSSNEELQSTNEELHSVNEELYTVNAEHQRKIQELMELTADMENLLESIDVGTIFLDRDLLIRKFTPQAKEMVRLVGTDIGRPLHHLTHSFPDIDLTRTVNDVLRNEKPFEIETKDLQGTPRLVRVLPYRSSGEVTGAVITMLDVSMVHEARRELTRSERQFSLLVENLEQIFWLVRIDDLHLEYVSPYLTEVLGIPAEPGSKTSERWFDAILPADVERVRQLFARCAQGETFETEYRVRDAQGGTRWLHARGRPVVEEDGSMKYVAGLAVDVTEQKRLQDLLERQLRPLDAAEGTDASTGLRNEEGLELALARELARSGNDADPATLLLLRFTNSAGDAAHESERLASLSSAASRVLRRCDIMARTGEREVAVLLPNYDRVRGLIAARSIRGAIHATGGTSTEDTGKLAICLAELPPRISALEPTIESLRRAADEPETDAPAEQGHFEVVLLDRAGPELRLQRHFVPEAENLLESAALAHDILELRSFVTGAAAGFRLQVRSQHEVLSRPGELERWCIEQGLLLSLDLQLVAAGLGLDEGAERARILPIHAGLLAPEGVAALQELRTQHSTDAPVVLLLPMPQLIAPTTSLLRHVTALREAGYLVGFDDVGLGHSVIEILIEIRPDLVRYAPRVTARTALAGNRQSRLRRLHQVVHPWTAHTMVAAPLNDAQSSFFRELGITWHETAT